MGKGRQIAGIVLDNYARGRRQAVWVSTSTVLYCVHSLPVAAPHLELSHPNLPGLCNAMCMLFWHQALVRSMLADELGNVMRAHLGAGHHLNFKHAMCQMGLCSTCCAGPVPRRDAGPARAGLPHQHHQQLPDAGQGDACVRPGQGHAGGRPLHVGLLALSMLSLARVQLLLELPEHPVPF